MRTFLLLSSLSPQGLQTLATTPERLFEVNREIERLGGRVVKQWALLGAYDFLSVVEAPDELTITKLTVELAARGSATFETLVAIPVEELIDALGPTDPRLSAPGGQPTCRQLSEPQSGQRRQHQDAVVLARRGDEQVALGAPERAGHLVADREQLFLLGARHGRGPPLRVGPEQRARGAGIDATTPSWGRAQVATAATMLAAATSVNNVSPMTSSSRSDTPARRRPPSLAGGGAALRQQAREAALVEPALAVGAEARLGEERKAAAVARGRLGAVMSLKIGLGSHAGDSPCTT